MARQSQPKGLDSLSDVLKRHNMRVTPQRLEILREVRETDTHPSATQVYRKVRKKFPSISLDTVTRTLEQFAKIGLCRTVEGYDDVRRYDGIVERHHHFHCILCNRILDVFHESLQKVVIPTVEDERFTVIDFKIVLEGICKNCRK